MEMRDTGEREGEREREREKKGARRMRKMTVKNIFDVCCFNWTYLKKKWKTDQKESGRQKDRGRQ